MTFTGKYLVFDDVTDADHTAKKVKLVPFSAVEKMLEEREEDPLAVDNTDLLAIHTVDPNEIRGLYEGPTATAYGDGSYTVDFGDGKGREFLRGFAAGAGIDNFDEADTAWASYSGRLGDLYIAILKSGTYEQGVEYGEEFAENFPDEEESEDEE